MIVIVILLSIELWAMLQRNDQHDKGTVDCGLVATESFVTIKVRIQTKLWQSIGWNLSSTLSDDSICFRAYIDR